MILDRKHFIVLSLLLSWACISTAQSIRTEFGKNRIQYHDDFDKWWEYESQNVIVYWYGKGRNIAQSAIQIAEYVHGDIQDMVEHRINDKIEIIVYTDLSDLLQSNIGNAETFETRHDETKVIGNRVFVYFDGNHKNLEKKIKEGITHVYFNAMYSPSGIQDVIDINADLKVDEWFLKGFVSYAGSPWDPYIEDELRDLWHIKGGRLRNFDRLSRDHARVTGHSFWHFLEMEYGYTSISTLLYLMRLRDDLKDNIEFIFGHDWKQMRKDWRAFYNKMYSAEEGKMVDLPEDNRISMGYSDYAPKSKLSLSPDGTTLIYVVNDRSRVHIVMMDIESGEREVLFKYGSKNKVQQADYNYPLIAWHATRPEITIGYEDRDLITLRKMNLRTGETASQTIPENLQRMYSLDYLTDDSYVLSGMDQGYSDLYTYNARNRNLQAVTEDYHDDIDASYVQLGEQWGMLFASNRNQAQIISERLDTVLPTSNFDLYFLPIDSEFAMRLTNTPDRDERQPKLVQGRYITYLDEYSGTRSRWVLDLNSRRRPYRNTDYDRNIITHESITASGLSVLQAYDDGRYKCYITEPKWTESIATGSSWQDRLIYGDDSLRANLPTPIDPGHLIVTPFDDPPVLEPLEGNRDITVVKHNYASNNINQSDRKVLKFVPARAVASRRKFKIEQLITKLDNEVLFDGLESNFVDNEIQQQPSGYLVKGIAKDIFEDYEVSIGARFPTNFRGSELFVYVDDKKTRLDKRYAIYRRQRSEQYTPLDRLREETWVGLYRLSYPLSTYRSVRASATGRLDRAYLLHNSPATNEFGQRTEQRIGLKLEYIFDNSLEIDMNLRHGTRYKGYVEFINRFDVGVGDGNDGFSLSKAVTGVVGFDARHYLPLLRHSILAFRGAGATSFGSEKMLYFIGGTDGWVTPKYDEGIPVPQQDVFAYKALAPNLRGFRHNVRNGQSFLLGSVELRIPIIKYLSRSELRSTFWRNIQLTAFVDGGSAWHGLLPGDSDLLNSQTITAPAITVQVDLDRSPFVYGYGFGARLHLIGHYIRADYAWGVESGLRQKPRLYISMGTEF